MDGDVWHRTGDSGYFDQRGRLWLMGRTSAVIQDHRGTLHPFAVECAATQYPGVCRSALLQHGGKRLLLVQPRDAAGCVSLKGLSETLSWAGIDEVRCLKRIPCDKRHNAKVDYPSLIRMVEKHRR
jgi:acyl-CoA synthetase (AMP-forming)/AMP-acid ligase II